MPVDGMIERLYFHVKLPSIIKIKVFQHVNNMVFLSRSRPWAAREVTVFRRQSLVTVGDSHRSL